MQLFETKHVHHAFYKFLINSINSLKDSSPTDIFLAIWTNEFLDLICRETSGYAQQKGNHTFNMDRESLLKALGVPIISGYVKLPQRKMFWERSPDTNNCAVTANMPRDRFIEILRYIHFNNMALDDEDRMSKIRPLISHMNEKFQELAKPLAQKLSIDEAMEPYYGHHTTSSLSGGSQLDLATRAGV